MRQQRADHRHGPFRHIRVVLRTGDVAWAAATCPRRRAQNPEVSGKGRPSSRTVQDCRWSLDPPAVAGIDDKDDQEVRSSAECSCG